MSAASVEPRPVPPAGEEPAALQRAVRDYLGHLHVERGLSENTLGAYRRTWPGTSASCRPRRHRA